MAYPIEWATGDTITAEKLNAMQPVVVRVVVEYSNNDYIVKSTSHTYQQIKALLENNVPVTALVTDMDGDDPTDHYGLVYTDSYGYGDYTYITFRGIRQTASDHDTYTLYELSYDIETGSYFTSKDYTFTPAT